MSKQMAKMKVKEEGIKLLQRPLSSLPCRYWRWRKYSRLGRQFADVGSFWILWKVVGVHLAEALGKGGWWIQKAA